MNIQLAEEQENLKLDSDSLRQVSEEQKVIEAIKVIKEYCKKTRCHICNEKIDMWCDEVCKNGTAPVDWKIEE